MSVNRSSRGRVDTLRQPCEAGAIAARRERVQMTGDRAAAQIDAIRQRNDTGQLRTALAQSQRGVILGLTVDKQDTNAGIIENIGRLRRRIGRIDRHRNRPQMQDRQIGQRPGHRVMGKDGHPLLYLYAQRQQRAGQPGDLLPTSRQR